MQRRALRTLQAYLQDALQLAANFQMREENVANRHWEWQRGVWSVARPGIAFADDTIKLTGSWLDRVPAPEVHTRIALFSLQQFRGVKVNGSEVKPGNVIERKGRLFQVLKAQHTQQGRGGAVIQAEIRDVQSNLKSTERFRTSEAIERVFVEEKHFTFLYQEGDVIFVMDPNTFEQMELSKELFGSGAAYLTDGMPITVQQYDGKALSAMVPPKVTCKVTQAEPYFKGQTATPTYKRAVLENGSTVLVPSFIVEGDEIVIDTMANSYITRSKE